VGDSDDGPCASGWARQVQAGGRRNHRPPSCSRRHRSRRRSRHAWALTRRFCSRADQQPQRAPSCGRDPVRLTVMTVADTFRLSVEEECDGQQRLRAPARSCCCMGRLTAILKPCSPSGLVRCNQLTIDWTKSIRPRRDSRQLAVKSDGPVGMLLIDHATSARDRALPRIPTRNQTTRRTRSARGGHAGDQGSYLTTTGGLSAQTREETPRNP
jgi:hypothetical protein